MGLISQNSRARGSVSEIVMVRFIFFFFSGSGSTYSSASVNLTEVSDTSFAMVREEKREEARVQNEGRGATRATRARGGEGRPLLGEGERGHPPAVVLCGPCGVCLAPPEGKGRRAMMRQMSKVLLKKEIAIWFY